MGPTASGKSELAVRIALRTRGEIISADSMLVYRGLDIGTDKPSREDRSKVPHHLIDIIEPSQEFSVFEYLERVLSKLREDSSRDKTFIVAGGSGLYTRALLHGLSQKPGADPEVRRRLFKEAEEQGEDILRKRLDGIDPDYGQIARDLRRVVRALEVYETSGRTMTDWDRGTSGLLAEPCLIKLFGIHWRRDLLRGRIAERVRRMLARGLIEETRRLREMPLSRTAAQAIGYREVIDFLEGRLAEGELEEAIVRHTLELVRRQMVWFRRERGVRWIELDETLGLDRAEEAILSAWGEHGEG